MLLEVSGDRSTKAKIQAKLPLKIYKIIIFTFYDTATLGINSVS